MFGILDLLVMEKSFRQYRMGEKKMKSKRNIDKQYKQMKKLKKRKVLTKGVELFHSEKGKRFETVDAMLADLDKNRTIFDRIRSAWHIYFWNYVSEIPLNVKTFIQRGIRGWAVSDTWGFDYYLSKVISEGVRHLSKHTYRDEAWKKKMKIIAETFETALSILEDRKRYIPSDEFTWKEYKKAKRFYKYMSKKYKERYHVMTKRESIEFERGFDLFKKNFFRLWD